MEANCYPLDPWFMFSQKSPPLKEDCAVWRSHCPRRNSRPSDLALVTVVKVMGICCFCRVAGLHETYHVSKFKRWRL